MTEEAPNALLFAKQETLASSILKAVVNLKKKGEANLVPSLLRGRLLWLNDVWSQFSQNHALLYSKVEKKTREGFVYFKDDIFTQIEESYLNAVDFINLRLPEPSAASTPHPPTDASTLPRTSVIRLAPIDLPEFAGNYLHWPNFRDMFDALVIRNTGLSNVERLQYLKSKLTGEANCVVRHVAVTDANFAAVWTELTKRYENPRATINALLLLFYNIPPVVLEPLSGLKNLRNITLEVLDALSNLKRPVEHWDDLVVFLLVQKLDKVSREEWETSLGGDSAFPTFARLKEFLDTRVRTLEALKTVGLDSSPKIQHSSPQRKSIQSHFLTAKPKCLFCQSEHRIYQCPAFKNLSVEQRESFVRKSHLCVNCLAKGHLIKYCTSKFVCSFCKRKHNTLLHTNSKVVQTPVVPTSMTSSESLTDHCQTQQSPEIRSSTSSKTCVLTANASTFPGSILLATARVIIRTDLGRSACVRALLDQGSETSFVTESVAQVLKLPRKPTNVLISGLGGKHSQISKTSTFFTVEPYHGRGPMLDITALVLPRISSYVPKSFTLSDLSNRFRHLELADPQPSDAEKFDLLIGADLYGRILLDGLIPGDLLQPTAQKTIFGWVLSGALATVSSTSKWIRVYHCSLESLHDTLKKFWEIEDVPDRQFFNAEEIECENHFLETHSRNSEGRYVVRLPFKKSSSKILGNSELSALSSLTRTENRMVNNPKLAKEYRDFLNEYEALGHMKALSLKALTDSSNNYLPHHPVFREDSLTSKIRVVFNASAPSTSGVSLNDLLLKGPKLQRDLSAILLKWRSHRFVFSADIVKMFRQILVHPTDQHYQCIFWRHSADKPISTFVLNTVTYGITCAPFLSLRVISQLAQDEGENFPLARSILNNQIYVDDLLFGGDDKIIALQTKDQVIRLLSKGGFQLRKWSSNCEALLQDVNPEDHGLALNLPLSDDDGLKLLGIFWNPKSDSFHFRVSLPPPVIPTKRNLLSSVSRIFDPLGWITPVVVSAKILLQSLWLLKIDWDDPIPAKIITQWLKFYQDLGFCNQVSIPRWTSQGPFVNYLEIHGFSDASSLAYSAVVYLRVVSLSGDVRISLVLAKSKVAPLKTLSIPRLELLGACLLTKCINHVQTSMALPTVQVYCWSDSQVVLCWLKKQPVTWKVFVANRVSDIQTRLPDAFWRYVPSNDNPADCASRGLSASDLVNHHLWWSGPLWLANPLPTWPVADLENESTTLEVRQQTHSHTSALDSEWDLLHRFSSWSRLIRVTAYVLRFIQKARRRFETNTQKGVSSDEIRNASNFWIKYVQAKEFSKELRNLSLGTPLAKGSSLSRLDPFLDEIGIIRLGGRLRWSSLTESQKHPVILPRPPRSQKVPNPGVKADLNHFSYLLIRKIHLDTLHGGTQLTLRVLRERYWVLDARRLVQTVIHHCVRCVRERARTAVQFMADLPPSRCSPSLPFSHTGVDYAGPFNIRLRPGRGFKSYKAWVALFVCLSTRAIHLELVNDYSTSAFLAAFDCFASRRGLPCHLYSDNGTNFRGADRELRRTFRTVIQDPELLSHLASDGVDWTFSPPNAPHFGGLWEAGVKSFKHHLRRMIGATTPTISEFMTLLCKIEACLNSRPIAPLNDDPDSFDALTPGHFLVGASLKSVPKKSYLDCEDNRLSRWQMIAKLTEQFWRVWSRDYLHSLQSRVKWTRRNANLNVGDLVLIKNSNLPPSKWELGRVIACFEGKDNLTRVVRLKTARTELTRPITQLCPLPSPSTSI